MTPASTSTTRRPTGGGSPRPVAARGWIIEPDLSNAVPFLAAAVVSGGACDYGLAPGRRPAGRCDLCMLEKLGSAVRQSGSYLEVQGAANGYRGIRRGPARSRRADARGGGAGGVGRSGFGVTAVQDAHLRGHGTDRLAALSAEINRLGGNCAETPDGLLITARPLGGGLWRSYADHRMATAGAIVGLRLRVSTWKTLARPQRRCPNFPQMWADMLAGD